jgi:hypothetical protein
MIEPVKFLNVLQERIDISNDDLADFLFIDKRTLYNYKNLPIDQLPNKVKEKLEIFFQGHEQFFQDDLTMEGIHERLLQVDANALDYIRSKFLEVAQIRRKTYVVVTTSELWKKQEQKRNVKNLDEFLEDVRILMEYSQLSKGYLYSILELVVAKVQSENDYQFLDYINKYQKRER